MVMRLALASHDALTTRELELLLEIYAAARRVEATFPDSDLACVTAKKIIASFHSGIRAAQALSLALH